MNLTAHDKECLAKAKQLIDADLSKHISIDALAQKVALGKTKLKQGFQQLFGQPVYSYVQQQRMILAYDLLLSTDKTIKQITRLVGFQHHNNFITAFRKYYGFTPGHVRKIHPDN